jgi:MFS family permease
MSSTSTPNGLGDRSLADLTNQLSQDVAVLVRKEADLAKAEVTEKARRLGVGVGLIAAAAVLGLVVLGAVTAAAILGLATTLAAWLSALIVAAVVGLVAGALALVGVKLVRRATPPVPTETAESVKEDVAWIKTQAKSGMK